MTANEFRHVIDNLIRQDKNFALFRLPGDKRINLITGKEKAPSIYEDINCLNGKSGFVIAPFHVTPQTPLVVINGLKEELDIEENDAGMYIYQPLAPPEISTREYRTHFETFIRSLKSGELDKLVLSRCTALSQPKDFSPALTFLKAAGRYIRSYVYLCHTANTGTWLGSTPEILLSGYKKEWHTVAMAGTQPFTGGELPLYWNHKNRKEQGMVAEYIRAQLAKLGINPVEEGPYTIRAAELVHLRSDFRFKLPGTGYLGDVLKLLHPTPAVCGLPKDNAYRFILENEGYDRRYYSGFVGMLDAISQTNLYVNLRCMEIRNEILYLYAGGGLLASSRLDEEWQETEDKLLTMKRLFEN